MPEAPPDFTLPIKWLFYDAIGTVLFGLGAARQFAGVDLVPEQYLWPGYAMPFMIAGVAMMAPLMVHIIRHGKAVRRSRRSTGR